MKTLSNLLVICTIVLGMSAHAHAEVAPPAPGAPAVAPPQRCGADLPACAQDLVCSTASESAGTCAQACGPTLPACAGDLVCGDNGPSANLCVSWRQQLVDGAWDTGGTFWMPIKASREADASDFMFYAVLALSLFFLTGITVCVVAFTIKYRHRPGHKAEPSAHHNDTLEMTWSIIPTIISVFLFIGGWDGYVAMSTRPAEPLTIKVTAQKWTWDFEYPNGWHSPNLHLPIDQPIELQMTSTDVLHAFYVPAFRVKQDLVPRRYTYAYITPTRLGTYRLYCAEYCGRNHSLMKVKAFVHEAAVYERFIAEAKVAEQSMDPKDLGKLVFDKACFACHTNDGSAKVGPTWKGTWGKDIKMSDGTTVKMDAQYVRDSVMEPQKQGQAGYAPTMPSYAGLLSEAEINGLAAYIESLK